MTLIRINAEEDRPAPHRGRKELRPLLERVATLPGPVIIMIHGYQFTPHDPRHCPHRHILSLGERARGYSALSWPRHLGFGRAQARDGVGIAFGWQARAPLHTAWQNARTAGQALARLIALLRRDTPERPVHILAHSMGAQVALHAMTQLEANDLDRVVLMTPATYQSEAMRALASPAGKSSMLITVTSRENALFDFLFERLLPSPVAHDRPLSHGIARPNAITLHLDRPEVLQRCAEAGYPIAAPTRRICHWSSYLRPGVFPLYRALFSADAPLDPERLRPLECHPSSRWSWAQLSSSFSPYSRKIRPWVMKKAKTAMVRPNVLK